MSIRWTFPDTGTALPDIAKMVRERLEQGGALKLEHDPAEIGRAILRQLQEKRTERAKGSLSLRLSSSGACIRRLLYDWHGMKDNGFKSDSSSVLAFATGDATEGLLVAAILEAIADWREPTTQASAAGEHVVPGIQLTHTGDGQAKVWLQVPFEGDLDKALAQNPHPALAIPGHPDGLGLIPRWQKGQEPVSIPFILEVKSMSDYAFKKFREHGMQAEDNGNPSGYYYQSQAYQLAQRQQGIDVEWTYLIAFGKAVGAKDATVLPSHTPPTVQSGKNAGRAAKKYAVHNEREWTKLYPLVGQWIRRDERVQADIIQRFQTVMRSGEPEEVDRPFGSDGKSNRLTFPCDWCPHLYNCYPGAREYCQVGGFFLATTKIHTSTD